MTQRMDSENELITCDVHGRILTWDCDYRDPVQVRGSLPLTMSHTACLHQNALGTSDVNEANS